MRTPRILHFERHLVLKINMSSNETYAEGEETPYVSGEVPLGEDREEETPYVSGEVPLGEDWEESTTYGSGEEPVGEDWEEEKRQATVAFTKSNPHVFGILNEFCEFFHDFLRRVDTVELGFCSDEHSIGDIDAYGRPMPYPVSVPSKNPTAVCMMQYPTLNKKKALFYQTLQNCFHSTKGPIRAVS